MTNLVEKISSIILQAIDEDKLVLPTMPEMALRVREVAEDPNASIKQLAGIIGQDAALAARIIKVANSAIYRGAKIIEDLNMALSRLGMSTTCALATGLAMEQMFQATSDLVDRRLRLVWNQSAEIAGICTVLCKFKTKLKPDEAALAGLVHQIGVLPILSYAEEHPSLLRDSFTLESVISQAHPLIGARILTAWGFPAALRQVPTEYLDFTREIAKADYADLVTVGFLQSLEAKKMHYEDLDYSTVTAFDRLGLDWDIDNPDAEDLTEAMNSAMHMLK
jgi:HD-like signal output (HDOD) protein